MALHDDEIQPFALSVLIENLPPELIALAQWVLWEWLRRDGRWTKPLINPATFRNAKSNSPMTWGVFEKVRKAVESGAYPGLGFVLWTTDPYCFIDLDKCRDPETGIIAPWALAIMRRFPGTYMEISPSGTGIKILIRGKLIAGGRVKPMGADGQKIEIYDKKYTTLTGHLVGDMVRVITDHQDALEALWGELFDAEGSEPIQRVTIDPGPLSDNDETRINMLRQAKNGDAFVWLYDVGDTTGYGNDRSRADQALANKLAWGLDADPQRVARAMQNSALARPKFHEVHAGDGSTYLEMTVAKAVASCRDPYRPAQPRPNLRVVPAPNARADDTSGRDVEPPLAGTVIEEEIPTPPPSASRVDIKDDSAVYLSAQDQHTKEVTRQAWDAICGRNDPPTTFMYTNRPTRLVIQADGTPAPEPLDERKLSHLAARAVVWYRTVVIPKSNPVEYEHRYAHPPLAIVRDMLEETGVALPTLSRIVQAPAYAPDGSISLDPGYHAPSESYYAANGLVVPPVPDRPTDQQIDDARDLIDTEVFGDFPLVDDADRAHAFAMLLQAFVRSCISGTTPLYMINKPKAGTGATLLAQTVALITSGQASVTMTQARSDDEMRKRITSTLRRLPLQILLDNVRGTLDDPSLASVLTARVWGDRILGESNNVEIPVSCTWVATGNNVGMSDEIARRSVPIRLDAQVERPDARVGWRHDHIEDWVIEHRSELVAACLTLCQAWFAAGRPKPTNPIRLGGYESWSRVIGGILEVVGLPGFLTNLRQFRERADVVTDVTKAFLERWWSDRKGERVTIKSLIPAATDVGIDLGKSDSERSVSTTLGMFVKRLEGQIYTIADDQLVRVGDAGKDGHSKAQLWMLEEPSIAEPTEPAEPFQAIRGRPLEGVGHRNTSMGTKQEGSVGSAGSAGSVEEEAF